MDFEKAYKEALERAKAGKPMDEVFPELKQSDDERIRKAISNAICGTTAEAVLEANGVKLVDALAYLEKQKCFQFGYPGLYFYDGEKLHFQGNPAMEENPYDFAMSQQDEQQPADWSEEDEKMLASFSHKVEVCDLLTNKENVWIVKRLKSLRPKPHWKPSEEQIESLACILGMINPDRLGKNKNAFDSVTELYNDLKNLI